MFKKFPLRARLDDTYIFQIGGDTNTIGSFYRWTLVKVINIYFFYIFLEYKSILPMNSYTFRAYYMYLTESLNSIYCKWFKNIYTVHTRMYVLCSVIYDRLVCISF